MKRLRNIDEEISDISNSLELSVDQTLWEIGTGTGECALGMASRVNHVYATDISSTMLAYAKKKAEKRKIGNVSFESGGFLSGFQPKKTVSGVVSQLALHHLPDFWKFQALVSIAGKLSAKGKLYLKDVVFPSTHVDYVSFFENAISQIRDKSSDIIAEQTVQHIKSEYSTLDWILEQMLERSGFRIISRKNQGFVFVYVCEKRDE